MPSMAISAGLGLLGNLTGTLYGAVVGRLSRMSADLTGGWGFDKICAI